MFNKLKAIVRFINMISVDKENNLIIQLNQEHSIILGKDGLIDIKFDYMYLNSDASSGEAKKQRKKNAHFVNDDDIDTKVAAYL